MARHHHGKPVRASVSLAAAVAALCIGTVGALPGVALAVPTTPQPPPPHEGRHAVSAPARTGHAQPAATGCSVPLAPPPAIDASEKPKPGELAPGPLPMPAAPVGGPRMADCGVVLPAGAPPVPAGEDSVSWVLADLDSGAVLAAKNPHARERPASLLKVLTALVVLEQLDLNTVVLGTSDDAHAVGSKVGVAAGGEYTVHQLLTGLIMNSGNDAANALARQLGGIPHALDEMARKAQSLGAADTRPGSPSGLDAAGMSTSAYDLALIYRAAIANPTFAEISKTRLFDWPGHGAVPGFKISNDNHMLASFPGTFGGKTGFTDDARHTRITAAERNGRRLVLVQMRGEQHPVSMDTQAARLLNYGFALPADAAPVGQLVAGPPAPGAGASTPAPQQLAAGTQPLTEPTPGTPDRPKERLGPAFVAIGGGALLGGLLSWLIARRRKNRPAGRHSLR